MASAYDDYKQGVTGCLNTFDKLSDEDRFKRTMDWYSQKGRAGYISAFEHETSGKLNENRSKAQRIEMGLPKSLSDINNKVADSKFYAVHAEWFLIEIDRIKEANEKATYPKLDPYHHALNNILQKLLLDSLQLLEDFGAWHQGVPGVFGIGKNRLENNVALYHAGWQAIYGTYSPLSFADNHAETAISHLRMNIELRLRHGFGVLGVVDKQDDTFIPLGLSKLIEAIVNKGANVIISVPIAHIDRIYRWANLYMHGGLKLYTWCGAASLEYLRPFLVGGPYKQRSSSVYAGIQARKVDILDVQKHVIDAIRAERTDPTRYDLATIPPEDCDLILIS